MHNDVLNRAMARWCTNPQAWRTAVRLSMVIKSKERDKKEEEEDIDEHQRQT